MWTRSLKCCLAVVLFTCAFLAGSGSVSADAYDGASAFALSSTGAHEDVENIPGAHDRHKGIRSYDSTGYPHDTNANRGVKSYSTPSGQGASHDHGIKGGGHGYNKNRDDCSKCKWENDDHWERDEPEEEGDENDGAECDDGQYRPAHHHGSGTRHKPGSHPSGVYKTGPTGVYVDDGVKGGGSPGPLGDINYPTGTGYTRPISDYGTTPRPGSSWNTPFASKPGYGGVTASTFGTTPSSGPDWNRGTTPGNFGSPPNPAWSGGHDGRFPSSQGPGAPVPNFDTTPKPGQSWNTNQFPSGSSSAVPHTGSGISPPSSYGSPQENQNRPYGQPGTQNSYAGAGTSSVGSPYGEAPIGRKDHPFGLNKPVNTQPPHGPYGGTDQAPSSTGSDIYYGLGGYDKTRPGSHSTSPTTVTNTFGTTEAPIGRKDDPFGLNKPINTQPPHRPYSETDQTPSNTGSDIYYGLGGYDKPRPGSHRTSPTTVTNIFRTTEAPKPVNTQPPHRPYGGTDQAPSNTGSDIYYGLGGYDKPRPGSYSTSPTTVTNTFGTTKSPYGGISSPRTVPGAQGNTFPRISPGSPTGSGVYEHPGVTKPSYGGSTSPWLGAGQPGSGSSTWHGTGTTSQAGFPVSNTGFGTTKTPFSHVSIPSSTLTAPYDRAGPRQPGFNVASSSATASAGATAFGTSPGTYSSPSTTGTPSFYGTTPAHIGGSSYTPGVKGSVGSTRPAYGTVPHGTHPNIEGSTWPGSQPGSSTGPWSSGKPGDGSGMTPDRYFPGASGNLPGKQPQGGSGTWPTGQPASSSETWPSKQPGDGSGMWPGQGQPGHGSGPGCPGGNCGGTTAPQGGGNCGACCRNYNCNGGCSGTGHNVPATHGLCGGIGPSGVNKTYYPAGTGDGNVPNIGTVYGPDSPLGGGKPVYPGTNQGASTEKPWNSANPFLFGGGTPSSVSRPWTDTTNKPIGQGNPFLDPSWNGPKPGHSNVYNDRNVIPHGKENTKPIGQGNPFLGDNNRRGDISTNPPSVIPLEGKIPEGDNPFLKPMVGGSSDSGGPSYGKQPDRSGTPGSFPGSGTPGNYPGSGTPGNYPGSGTPGNYPGSGTPGNYPGSGTPGNYPGSGTPGNYPGSGTPGNYPGSGTPGNYPGSGTPGNYPGSGTPGNYPGSGTPGNYPGSGTPGNYPGSGTPGNYPGSGTPGDYPGSRTPEKYSGSGIPENYPGSGTPGNYPGSGTPGNYPGSGTPGNYPGSRTPENYPGSGTPGNYPGSRTPENYPGSGTPGNYPGSRTPEKYPGSGTPENYPGSGTPGNYPGSGTPGNYPGSGIPGSGSYGGVKGGFHSGGVSPQDRNSGRSYPTGGNPQGANPLQCKLGLFGCGTPGSGSYEGDKYPGGAIGGNVGTGTGNPGGVGNVPGGPGNPGIAPMSGHFAAGAGHPGSGQAGAYAGSFSSAQASSSSYAGSFSGAPGPANNVGGNWSPNAAQNQGGPNPWASSGASAFASSNSGSWSGNPPVDVRG